MKSLEQRMTLTHTCNLEADNKQAATTPCVHWSTKAFSLFDQERPCHALTLFFFFADVIWVWHQRFHITEKGQCCACKETPFSQKQCPKNRPLPQNLQDVKPPLTQHRNSAYKVVLHDRQITLCSFNSL